MVMRTLLSDFAFSLLSFGAAYLLVYFGNLSRDSLRIAGFCFVGMFLVLQIIDGVIDLVREAREARSGE